MKILFIADYYYYKNANGKTSHNFMNYISGKGFNHNIKIIYTDYNISDAYNEIIIYNPDIIIFFEINAFQSQTQNFKFVFDLNKKVFVFLDDSYYITSLTSKCECINYCDGIIFWYRNDRILNSYKRKFPNKITLNFDSRYVNTEIYRDYKLEKKYDIFIYGNRNFLYNYKNEELEPIQNYIKNYEYKNNIIINDKINFYPLRSKLETILTKNSHKYSLVFLPESTIDNSQIVNEDLSKLINQSHLTVACSSIADVLLHKHLEIPASKSVILGSYPTDYKDLFEGNIVEVNEFMSEEEIITIIDNALSNKDKLNEMSNRLYAKIHNEHNLQKAQEDFNNLISSLI